MRALTLGEFAGAEGTAYRIDLEGQPSVEMTLETVAELPPAGRAEGSFRLEFRGPPEPILPQAIYQFSKDDDCFDIFIVPVGRDESGVLYEAIFN